MNTLNTELHDVQRIMVQNIDDVLQRGAVLSGKKKIQTQFLMIKNIDFVLQNLIRRHRIWNTIRVNTKKMHLCWTPHPGWPLEPVEPFCFWSSLFGTSFCFEIYFFERTTLLLVKKHLKYFPNKTYPAFQMVFKVILNSIINRITVDFLGYFSPERFLYFSKCQKNWC